MLRSLRSVMPLLCVMEIFTAAASAGTIANFVIVSASDLSPVGGAFTTAYGDIQILGTFSGSFTVDLSALPGSGSSAPLLSANIVTYFDDASICHEYTAGMLSGTAFTSPRGTPLVEWLLDFADGSHELQLYFDNVAGTFVGGQVVYAKESFSYGTGPGRVSGYRTDASGDALALDPEFLAPEPGSLFTMLSGAALLGVGGWKRRATANSAERLAL